MTGIVHESRLNRLLHLRDRLNDEIATERVLERQRARNAAAKATAAEALRRQQHRAAVSAAVVRRWAATYGHPYPERGRVPDDLIDLYLAANPQAITSRGRA